MSDETNPSSKAPAKADAPRKAEQSAGASGSPVVPGDGQFANEAQRDETGHPVAPDAQDRPASASHALGTPVLSDDAPKGVVGESGAAGPTPDVTDSDTNK